MDITAVMPINYGKSDKRVLIELTCWVTMATGRSLLFCPRFFDSNGVLDSQPYVFANTTNAAFNGYIRLRFMHEIIGNLPVNMTARWMSTGAGDTVTVSGDKMFIITSTPLGS